MRNKVFNAIKEYNMIHAGDTVVVGVSGGADSMALLHFLYTNREQLNIDVIAAHVNHMLRGKHSNNDETFVKTWCDKRNIKCFVRRVNIEKQAKASGLGLEECGRNKRYEFFYELSYEFKAKVATAHTLSDNVETVFLNLSRGTGLLGLCGIPAVRDDVIRPLIFATREDIELYCSENNIGFVTDSTNFSEDYNRNKIRLSVLPILKKINTEFEESAGRMIASVIADNEYIKAEVLRVVKTAYKDEEHGYDISILKSKHPAIKSRAIMEIVKTESSSDIEKTHVDLIIGMIDSGHGKLNIPGGFFAYVDRGFLKVSLLEHSKKIVWKYELDDSVTLTEQGREFIIKIMSIDDYIGTVLQENTNKLCALDYNLIPRDTVIRNRREGDRLFIPSRKISKPLKKLFNEEKIPCDMRDKLAILSSGNEILWVEGFEVPPRFMVSEKTDKVVCIYSK